MKKYHMQKSEREITDPKLILEILINGKYTTLALTNNTEPYIISLSYGYDERENCLYFHTAKQGLKFEFLKKNPLVCGTVIEDLGYKTNQCSHAYRSIVYWGKVTIIENLEEKRHAFNILLAHLEENPDRLRKKFLSDEKTFLNVCMLRLRIQEITGKASR